MGSKLVSTFINCRIDIDGRLILDKVKNFNFHRAKLQEAKDKLATVRAR